MNGEIQLNPQIIISIVVGFISMIMVFIYAIPQFVKILKTRNTSAISFLVYICFIISSSGMLAWAIGNGIKGMTDGTISTTWLLMLTVLPAVLLNIVNVAINIICLLIKIHNVRLAKKRKVSELEISKMYLAKKERRK